MTLGTLLEEPARIHGLDRARSAQDRGALLARLGLPPALLPRYPHQVSGGQARRVAIARALSLAPSLLIADEPTAGLDVSVQGELLNLLLELHRERGLTLLVSSHDLAVIRHLTTTVAVLYAGEVVGARSDGRRVRPPRPPLHGRLARCPARPCRIDPDHCARLSPAGRPGRRRTRLPLRPVPAPMPARSAKTNIPHWRRWFTRPRWFVVIIL